MTGTLYSWSAVVLLVIAAAGHAAIWVAAINRLHASGWPHAIVQRIDKLLFSLLVVPPPVAAFCLLWVDLPALMPWRVFASRELDCGHPGL